MKVTNTTDQFVEALQAATCAAYALKDLVYASDEEVAALAQDVLRQQMDVVWRLENALRRIDSGN